MKKIGIIYGSSTGTTEGIAEIIAEKLGVPQSDVHNVANTDVAVAVRYDMLFLGSSTWGDGELQDDWGDLLPTLKHADLSGKVIALFGCGDSSAHDETFCDAIGILYEELKHTGAKFCGQCDPSDYDFTKSKAVVDGKFVGLPIDEMNESNRTEDRIDSWLHQLKSQCPAQKK